MAITEHVPSLASENRYQEARQLHGEVIDAISGLIQVYRDGHVERPEIVPCVTAAWAAEFNVISKDTIIDKLTNLWARFYVPKNCQDERLSLLVYFHGGGFCVGSVAWVCYHEFLAQLSMKTNCVIMSVNYRLAPENPLPAAYDDGFKALWWLKQAAQLKSSSDQYWWSKNCNFASIFLSGDSAGANIVHNVVTKLCSHNAQEATNLKPILLKGTILIQPFFGGETRTKSEKYLLQPQGSALNLAASDTYWRLALPRGANRDHPWCNPLSKGSIKKLLPTLVCISEKDILKDRNREFGDALASSSGKVECKLYKGVGHAFQILDKSQLSQNQRIQMIAHIREFIFRHG